MLAITPAESSIDTAEYDINGHSYPDYYYCVGKTTDILGTTTARAVPMRDCVEEMAGSTIL